MLYDSVKDHLIPEITIDAIWKPCNIKKQDTSTFEIFSEDMLSNKMSQLGICTDLQLSIIGGLVKVSKSAEYLHDHKSSQHIAQVTLRYRCTTKFEHLLTKRPAQFQYSVVTKDIATHIVIGVLYGAEAFFVFEREVSQEENIDDVQNEMERLIKRLPSFANGEKEQNDNETSHIEKLRCKFYCDCVLPETPTSFRDAVEVYKQLPKVLSTSSIPKLAWLHPLSNLDKRTVQVKHVQGVTSVLVTQIEELFDNFHILNMNSRELLNCDIYSYFPSIREQIADFISLIKKHKSKFIEDLAALIPQIRVGRCEEADLNKLITQQQASPLNIFALTSWLEKKKREASMLSQYLKQLHEVPGESTVI